MFNFNLTSKVKTVEPKELTEEIKSFRKKNKEFQATNEHETYLIVCFSCKQDKEVFCENAGITEHTLIDGYELARSMKIEPAKPSFELHKPITT